MSRSDFTRKRTAEQGLALVETGYRRSRLTHRLRWRGEIVLSRLSMDDMYDLADALDKAISKQEDNPLSESTENAQEPWPGDLLPTRTEWDDIDSLLEETT